jgi:hypothetical protein
MDFGQRQPLLGEGVGEVAPFARVQPAVETINLVLDPLLSRLILALREILELLQLVLLQLQPGLVGGHGPANGELCDHGSDRQPVQDLGDDPVAVLAVA